MIYQYKVNANKYIGLRLDKYISLNLSHLSRSKIKFLINNGKVFVNTKNKDPDYKILKNDKIKIIEEIRKEKSLKGEKIKLNIVYEDKDLIVIDKPSGLVMHPGAGNQSGTLVNALINHCGDSLSFVGDNQRPGIVHRIDKDTSGLVVVAKNDFTHAYLSEQFSKRIIKRKYIAVCWGVISPPRGVITTLISRSDHNRTKMKSSKVRGKKAVTHYKILKTFKDEENNKIACLVECELETGRTHQIRVHLSEKGHPLFGDRVYGRSPSSKLKYLQAETKEIIRNLPGQALHAQSLGFRHPTKEKNMNFQSVTPVYLSNLINSIKAGH